ncbi:GntR family transcriptional regulator [Methylobacterium nonmethylotrophicum]|uniref:GntR family transcriptional regulator n=2 Tax=Methylobacterium nonmethylotrophicum TaxID=1141884 RepID=A0A4Z0NZ40_9HYPH|nr:GntR family transcriptional regulator [Methylobacterium nonmethylotrophicum]TGE02711.1 GntR family transcriptional regulator [Methylobacterium nonmethylotrophicum]
MDAIHTGLRKAQTRMPRRDPERPPPASAVIRQELRARIASLAMRPGEPISEKTLARQYGVSRTPVHEAVLKLAEEGLVAIFPQSGTFVALIPYADLPEAIIVRRSLEETSARLAAERGETAGLAAIDRAMEALARAARAGDREAFHQADEAFHARVAQAAGYPGIWRLVQQVKVQVDRFRRLTLPQAGRLARVIDEHGAVRDAIAARDPEAAARRMGAHVGALLADLDDIADLNPDYFEGIGRAAGPRP